MHYCESCDEPLTAKNGRKVGDTFWCVHCFREKMAMHGDEFHSVAEKHFAAAEKSSSTLGKVFYGALGLFAQAVEKSAKDLGRR